MAIFRGIRGIGQMTPEARSAALQAARALKKVAARVNRVIANEDTVQRAPGVQQLRSPSAGGRVAPVTFGTLVDRPTSAFLLARGVGAMLYIATDSGTYWWSGTAWTGPL